jgi:hypothetical protein
MYQLRFPTSLFELKATTLQDDGTRRPRILKHQFDGTNIDPITQAALMTVIPDSFYKSSIFNSPN